MKVLSVGNSFSVDSQRFVRQIAAADGVDIVLGNLYIGGCSLETHCANIKSALPKYEYFKNNRSLGSCSILTGLMDEDWDVITVQQASHFSGMPETYEPYIRFLCDYIRLIRPKARIWVNETWAYEDTSTHSGFAAYNCSRTEMYERLKGAYTAFAEAVGAEILPVGDAVENLRLHAEFNVNLCGTPITRDGFHLSLVEGRYLAGAVWYEKLTGNSILDNAYVPCEMEYVGRDSCTDEEIFRPIPGSIPTKAHMDLLKQVCHETVKNA